MRRIIIALVFATVSVIGGTLHAGIAAEGKVYKKDGGMMAGLVKWSPRGKAYAVSQKQSSGGASLEIEVTLKEVDHIEIKQPPELNAAIQQVEAGRGSAAIPVLVKIVDDYAHLQWDSVASAYLARAYLAANNAAKALEVCEKIVDSDPTAGYSGDLAPSYWQALIKNGKQEQLNKMLAKAAASGDRFASASALIARGDAIVAKEDTPTSARKALVDGYLRVILLYTDADVAQRVRPEALYKGAKCFERVGQTSRASDLRNELKSKYASSPWAAK